MRQKNLILSRSLHGGEQRIYRFPNGLGASVVRTPFSYGGRQGLWELALVHWPVDAEDETDFVLDYDDQPPFDDVVGHLTESDVDALLATIDAREATYAQA